MSKLSERAMLAALRISTWQGMMVDKEVTDGIAQEYKAQDQAGRYNKRLVKASFLKDVSATQSKARQLHRLYTLPWEDDGTRILAATGFLTYQKAMKEAKEKVEEAVKVFLKHPEAYIDEAKVRLGDMFNEGDYPSDAELKAKFGFDVEIKALPEASDFRANLTAAQANTIMKDMEDRMTARLNNALNDVFGRVTEVVSKMNVHLKDYTPSADGNRGEGSIRANIVYNIYELANLLPELNITNDQRITDLTNQLKTDLLEHSPEILRADPSARKATQKKADAILKKIQGYMK